MGSWLHLVATAALALALTGEGLLSEGDGTTLPITPSGNLPVMDGSSGDVSVLTDAGLLWTPTPLELSVQQLDAGSAPPAADGGQTSGACAPLSDRIAHRRAFIAAVELSSDTHGLENGPIVYCQQHPVEAECLRAPIAVERELAELIQNSPDEPRPEADGWIVRWSRELAACLARQPRPGPAPRTKPRGK